MNPFLPEVRVGEPLHCEALTVFPLFAERSLFSPEYILAHEAMELGTVTVREVSDAGSIPDLLVENNGDLPCLILEGTELRGSKQHRMLNATALIGQKSQARIPVSCVEQGRWRYESQQSSSGSHCPPSLRSLLKGSAASRRHGLGSHQIAMWAEIRRKHRALGVPSTTEDLSAALDTHRERVEQVQKRLPYPNTSQRDRRSPWRQAHLHRHPRQAHDPGKGVESSDGRVRPGCHRNPRHGTRSNHEGGLGGAATHGTTWLASSRTGGVGRGVPRP